MFDPAGSLVALRSSGPESSTLYKPRRAMVELPEPSDAVALDRIESPGFRPAAGAGPAPIDQWASPVGPPTVEDLGLLRGGGPVARELNQLRAADTRWVYLSGIPGGKNGSEIGHLVIGPGGIFTINARHYQDARAWMGGDIRIGGYEAQRTARLLTSATRISIRVRGLLVPVDAARNTPKHQPAGVEIVNHSALVGFLRSQPPYLDGTTIARVLGYARLSSTWRTSPGLKGS